MEYKLTSIIILKYKELDKFEKMMEILLKHTHHEKTPYEIIIVDNSKINLGTSKGLNLGISKANGHYACFFNSDYYMMDNWLESMIDCFEHQKGIGLVSCCTNVTGNDVERRDIIDFGDWMGADMLKDGQYKYIESDCAIAQMFTTRDIWKEVGGFCEEYFPVEFEDLDFNMRIKSKGYKIFVNGKCFGYHDHNRKSETNIRETSRNKNREIFRKKWGNVYTWA